MSETSSPAVEETPADPIESLWEDNESTPFRQVPEWAQDEPEPTVVQEAPEPEVPPVPRQPRCAIPMCGGRSGELLPLGCAHYLHSECLGRLLRATRYPECPMCRNPYLTHMRRVFEQNRFADRQPTQREAPRPPNVTRYGERYNPEPLSRPISYGSRHQMNVPEARAPQLPGPLPGHKLAPQMGLEALRMMNY